MPKQSLKKPEIARAVVISFNWETGETLNTTFDGDGAAAKAQGWAHKDSFLWKDFPAAGGWTHFFHWNEEAGKQNAARMVASLTGGPEVTIRIPT